MSIKTQTAQIERDCTEKCKSKLQAGEIFSVLTKRCITDFEICSFLNYKCLNCALIFDNIGRTALHFAASCGRKSVCDWLVNKKNALINLKDFESGYTALHRSIFYGKINSAVTLIQLGANTNIFDNNDLTPLDHALKDNVYPVEYNIATPCQVYVWGSNTNYTLGTGTQHSRNYPELLDSFYRKYGNISIKQVCLAKFHFVLVSNDGRVFSCGHGHGGRLGLGTENTVLEPLEVKFNAINTPTFACKEVAIGRDHTLFLSEIGQVWSCGLNTNHVLGLRPPPPQVVVPRLLTDFKHQVTGICASRFHSVAWGPNGIFTWGLHAGQLGHDKGPQNTQIAPKLVTYFSAPNMEIVSVATSDGSTVVSTKKGDVYILHEYQCRKIASRQLNIIKTVAVGGHLDPKISSEIQQKRESNELKVIILTSIGNILIWQESFPQLTRCIYNLNRSLIVKDITLNKYGLLFITSDGEAFKGELKPRKKKVVENSVKNTQNHQFNEFLEKDDCQILKVHKIQNIHRGAQIQSDLKGGNFAVLQVDPSYNLINVPQISEGTLRNDLLSLLKNSDEMDSVHDVTFKIGHQLYPVHRYIIAQKSPFLASLFESQKSETAIELTNIDPLIFQQILYYVYTGTCDLLKIGECPEFLRKLVKTKSKIIEEQNQHSENLDENISAFEHYSKINQNNAKNEKNKQKLSPSDPVRLLQESAKKFGLKNLCKKLEGLVYNDGFIQKKTGKFDFSTEKIYFDRGFKNMHDVVIKCNGGKEILAHKSILAARLEYFNNIFAVRWNMNSTRNTISLPISGTTLEPIIEFLYTDDVKSIQNSDIDFISNLLIVADQLFIERLKEICEVALSQNLTLKNCSHMLQFADTYNAKQLKNCCMEYVCLNLSAILEMRTLEILDPDILDDLTNYYCEWNKNLSKRVITPFPDAPTDETVKNISELYPIVLNSDDLPENHPKSPKAVSEKKKKGRTRKISENKLKNKDFVDISPRNPFLDINLESEINVLKNETENQSPTKKSTGQKEIWTKILTEKEKHEKIVKARLKAAQTAQDISVVQENYTKLVKNPNQNNQSPQTKKIDYSEKNYPVLGKSTSSTTLAQNEWQNSPGTSKSDRHWSKSPVLTKRIEENRIKLGNLSMSVQNDGREFVLQQKYPKLSKTPQKPFFSPNSPISSPQNISFEMESPSSPLTYEIPIVKVKKISQKQRKKLAFDSVAVANELGLVNKKASDFSDIPETPIKNPWKKIEEKVEVVENSEENFANIVAVEKKLKENWTKMKTKPLVLTQMEDKAIVELLRFYNADDCAEEFITIQRVETAQYIVPLWVQAKK